MIKRVIFLIHYPLRLRDYQRLGVDLLNENGFQVEIWNLTSLIMPFDTQEYDPIDLFYYEGEIIFYDKRDVRIKLSRLSEEDIVICTMRYSYDRFWLYRALGRTKAKYAIESNNLVPTKREIKSLDKLPKIFNTYRVSKLCKMLISKFILNRIPLQHLGIKPADFILGGGEKSVITNNAINKGTDVLWAHATDYDRYLEERDTEVKEKPVAVFLDQFLPFHPHGVLAKSPKPFDAERYYALLNNFFNIVEEQTGLEVIIASHPRSNYEHHPEYFDGRRCIKEETVKLIRMCRFAMAHHSTVLNFANLVFKPVIFLTYSDLDNAYDGATIREFAKWFGKRPIAIDKEINIDWAAELEINANQYDYYRNAYIKTDFSEDLPFWQIVANRLKSGNS